MYATTKIFLDYFNLSSLDELPPLTEIREFEKITAELGFELDDSGNLRDESSTPLDGAQNEDIQESLEQEIEDDPNSLTLAEALAAEEAEDEANEEMDDMPEVENASLDDAVEEVIDETEQDDQAESVIEGGSLFGNDEDDR